MRTHAGEDPEINQIQTQNQAKQDDLSKEEMPHISDSNYDEGLTLSLSPPMCLSTRTLSPPNEYFTCFITFHPFVGIHFYKADRPGVLSLATVPGGLVARIQHSHCRGLTSTSGQGTETLLQGHSRSRPAADTVLASLELELSQGSSSSSSCPEADLKVIELAASTVSALE